MASVPPNMIRGVRISCDWDVTTLKAKKYIACDVPKNDPVFHGFMMKGDLFSDTPTPSFPVSPLFELVGLPFHVRKIPPNRSLPGNDVTDMKDKDVSNRYTNQEATLLLIAMDPRREYRGFAPSFWQSNVGNVLVTGVGGKVITPQQVEALCAYVFYLLNGPLQEVGEQMEEGEEKVLEYKKVMDKVTPAKFGEYFGYYKKIKEMEAQDWVSIKKLEEQEWVLDTSPVMMTSSMVALESSGC